MELWDWTYSALVVQLALLDGVGYSIVVLGQRTSASCILDSEFPHFLVSLFISDVGCLSQFPKIEQGDDSANMENSFA